MAQKKYAIIFDLDGTLFDCEKLAYISFRETLQRIVEKGHYSPKRWDENMYKQVIGMTSDELFDYLLPGESKKVHEYAQEILEMNELKLIASEGKLFPSVAQTLEKLHSKEHTLFIASNGGAEYVPTVLSEHKIKHLFRGVYCAGLHQTKSKVDLVKLLLQETDCEAIMVGDRFSDIEAGKKNNIYTVGCTYGFGSIEEVKGADFLIDRLDKIFNIIERI